MVVLTLRGVEINFPFEPYACQADYMKKVIQCLQEGVNGILESPTGTGKTLSLLCAALAWRETYLAHLQLNIKIQETKASGEFCESLQEGLGKAAGGWNLEENGRDPKFDIPKIIYTSRTHSQLSQAVKELKNTIYKPKVCVLGSREQMCIHPGVMKQETNTAKVHMCRSKISTRSCHFYNNLEANQSNPEFSENIMDIEDLVELGNKRSVCPYYLSRSQRNSADIVFMPYNYLLDAKSRSANNVDIANSVILFDEAHNLESICEEAVSFDLTSFDIASCVDDLDRCLDTVTKMEEEGTLSLSEDSGEGGIEKKEVAYMKGLFLMLEEELHSISSSSSQGITKPGPYIFELLKKVKITFETQNQVVELLEKCNTFLVANSNAIKRKQFSLAKFSDALKIVFKTENTLSNNENLVSQHYKVHIETQDESAFKKSQLDVWSSSKGASRNKGFTLGYWCFSPGETMKDLMRCKLRSIILTSGTLSPLLSFKAELQIAIPVQLQNPHVIKEHQICVGILKAGPDGVALNSSYQNRSKPTYLNSLGNALVNFARIVPDGMLVFFPSYTVMNLSLKHWQSNGVWARLNEKKEIFVEPRNKAEFAEAMEGFYEKIQDSATKGAAFFAVCRGKVSEGLDFADMNGRAVVITGLPYPPRHNARVKLKMDFLDEVKNKRTFQGLSGKDWYQQQASRAVNQAVGRVLRHKDDYGAIILCDERFCYANNVAELPLWVKPYVKKYNNFGEVQRHLTQFFRRADQLCDKSYIKKTISKNQKPLQDSTEKQPVSSVPPQKSNKIVSGFQEIQTLKNRSTKRRDEDGKGKLTIQYEVAGDSSGSSTSRGVTSSTSLDKSKGFFDSLETYETEKQRSLSRETTYVTECNSSSSCSTDSSKEPAPVSNTVKRKFKIVKSKCSSNGSCGKESEATDKVASVKKSETTDKITSAKKYLLKTMEELGKEKFSVFSTTLREYKQNSDLNSLLRSLTPLLLTDKEHYGLFLGFSTYVKSTEQKELFFQKYRDLTGEEIPEEFQKRKRENKPEKNSTQNKKARIETS